MKAWIIALKDTRIRFRDRNAILLMLVAPLIISAIMGAAFGNITGGGGSPISEIPIIVVNADEGELGGSIVDILISIKVDTDDGSVGLFSATETDNLDSAREQVESGEVRGVVYIPANFSELLEQETGKERETAFIQLFTDPSSSVSPSILRGVANQIASGFSTAVISQRVVVDQVMGYSDVLGPRLANLGAVLEDELTTAFRGDTGPRQLISLETITIGEEDEDFNILGYFAPSMAIFFLMFTMFDGTRSILEEEQEGTLHRLMITPTWITQILLGKIGGTFLTGILQFWILVVASALIFRLSWGNSILGLVLMGLGTIAAATSLGAFVASFARNTNQANIIGTVVTLVFAMLGGNFVQTSNFPTWLDSLSKLTINRWSLDGFIELTLGGRGAVDILPNFAVLLGIGLVFLILSLQRFNRRFVK